MCRCMGKRHQCDPKPTNKICKCGKRIMNDGHCLNKTEQNYDYYTNSTINPNSLGPRAWPAGYQDAA